MARDWGRGYPSSCSVAGGFVRPESLQLTLHRVHQLPAFIHHAGFDDGVNVPGVPNIVEGIPCDDDQVCVVDQCVDLLCAPNQIAP